MSAVGKAAGLPVLNNGTGGSNATAKRVANAFAKVRTGKGFEVTIKVSPVVTIDMTSVPARMTTNGKTETLVRVPNEQLPSVELSDLSLVTVRCKKVSGQRLAI